MTMSTIQEFEAAAAKATQASAQADTWANGPINTNVPTDSGPVPTIAEFNRAAQARVNESIEAIGWVLAGDFTAGCTVTDRNQYVLVVGGSGYRWDGVLPKVVAPGSTPTPIATGAWVLVGDATLRGDLAAPGGAGLIGIYQSNISKETAFVSPEMYGAGNSPSVSDTQPLIDAFTDAKAMGVSVKLSRLYKCSSNISLSSFISDVFGLGQGQTGIIFESGFGMVVDNTGITGTRKAMRIINTSLRTRGNLNATAIKFKGASGVKYAEQLKLTDVLFATDETGSFGWDCCVELDTASQVYMDHCSMSGLGVAPTNCCIRIKNTSRGINFTNGYVSDFTQFMDVTSNSEGVTVAFNHIVAGRRGIVARDECGNSICVIGNHFNTSLSAVELGDGIGAPTGSNHCKISENFNIVFDHPLDSAAPYVGFDICSNYNQLVANEVLLTGFTKPNVIHTRLRGNTGGTRFATSNSVVNPLMNTLSQGVVISAGAIGNQIHGCLPVGMTLANTIVDSGTNTRYWTLDSDINAFLTGDIKLHRVGATGTRQIRAHTSGDPAVADGILRFTGGTAGVSNGGIAELTFKETVTKVLRPTTGNTYTCGAPGASWAGGFTQTAFTVTSDERTKTRPVEITDAMLDAVAELDWVMFQIIGRILEKGEDSARWHIGVIAQRVKELFEKHGIDAHEHAFFCYDKWAHEPAVIDHHPAEFDMHGMQVREGWDEVVKEEVHAGELYSIRYEELLALKIKQIERDQKRKIDALMKRVEALEANYHGI